MGATRRLKAPAERRSALAFMVCLVLLLFARGARADVTVLVGEPYGSFGTMMPSGHVAIYFDHLCSDGPLKLRLCNPGEQAGVVLARYHALGDYDWVATPVMEFLYAVDEPREIPAFASAATVNELLESYRRRYLETVVPDGREDDKSTNEWVETAGAAYTRKLWAYSIASTRAQDVAMLEFVNADRNRHRYHLAGSNCADFAADVLNVYYPGIVSHPDRIADLGLMSPKQVVRLMTKYAAQHPEVDLRISEVPQVPGTLRRSRPVRGCVEAELKTKRYLFTLLAIQPEIPAITALLYLDRGRWVVGRGATLAAPGDFAHREPGVLLASGAGSASGGGSGAAAADIAEQR